MKTSSVSRIVLSLVAGSCMSGAALAGDGPDVIVGDLPDFSSYTPFNGIAAFAVGTTSCNVGNRNLAWVSSTNQHPVIGQNLYRWRLVNGAGQYEQIGASWLKHGFTALNGTICGPCSNPDGTGATLDPTCSDPYSAGLNGSQSRLGPRSQVNAYTGFYPYPFTASAIPTDASSTIWRRLQVRVNDVLPSANPGAWYFAEGHYIAADDAAAGNSVNNAAYRRVNVTGTSTALTMSTVAGFSTQRTLPAIYGWTVAEPGVTVRSVVVPNEGTFNIAYKVTALANGMYHYEYMLHNLNSDRSAASFQLNLPAMGSSEFTEFANVGFRDVESHSGEPYSNVDWTSNRTSGAFGWGCTQTFTQNANANALRWGTSYTFRFDSNMPPVDGTATIGLFKTGTPAAINVAGMKVPANAPCIGDFNQDGGTDGSDVSAFFGSWENADASADVNRDGGVDGSDVERFIVQWVAGC
jgi:hypothetical protein